MGSAIGMVAAAGLEVHSSALRAKQQKSSGSGVTAVVLGSSQDGGVPHAGCRCPHCEAARKDPRLRRRSPCLALLHHGERKAFLIDAGPDLPSQIDDLPPDWSTGRNPVDGILLSHAHIGHYAGLVHLGREVLGTSDLPVYCSEQFSTFLRENGPWSLLVELGNIDIRTIKPGQTVELVTGISVEPISVIHRAEFTDTLFFIINGPNHRLLYLTDIDRWPGLEPPIEKLISTVDVALLDGTFYSADELPGRDMSKIPHPPVVETMNRLSTIAEKGKTRIVFTHLNHSNLLLDADGKLMRDLRSGGFDIAFDGMEFAL